MTDELYEKMIELLPDGVVIHGGGKVLFANETACRLMKATSKDQLVGARVIEFVHPDYRARALARIAQSQSSGALSQPEEEVFLTLDGEELPVLVTAQPFHYQGEPAMLTVCTDMRERKAADQALRDSEQRLQAVFAAIRDGVLVMDREQRRFVFANNAICRMLGYTREELLQIDIARIHPPEDVPHVAAQVDRQFRGEIDIAADTPVKRKDGSVFLADINSAPFSLNGRLCLLGVFRDMTERQRLLETVLKAQKIESLAVLAGGIAHDFNNLLSGIFGYIDLALMADPSRTGPSSQYLSSALGVIDRARALTGQLLTFSSGSAPSKKTETLTPFVEETIRFALSGSSHSCRFDIPPDVWSCDFDRHQIAQVLDNLVRNADQAMSKSGTVHVAAQNLTCEEDHIPTLRAGRYVAISVRDTGIGIPAEILPRIFDPFFTTKPQGHGLGLATCYSIATQHGGGIEVESTLGAGSTFTLFLRASEESQVAQRCEKRGSYRGSGRVLVLDDEGFVRHLMTALLQDLGFEVVTTSDGAQAIDAYRQAQVEGCPFVAAFFDLTVQGGMGGQEAVNVLRERGAELPIFVASGYADAPVMAAPNEYGFTASLAKPFIMHELVALLARHCPPEAKQGA